MAAIDSPSTLSELQVCLAEALKENYASTAVATILGRYLNLGLQDMHEERWPWAERRTTLQTHPGYATGTVDIALATRTTVAGTDTFWNTAVTGMGFNNSRVGGKVVFAGGVDPYEISVVGSDTSWTLAHRYIGAAALTAATYQYYEDEYALASDFDDLMDLRYFSEDRTITVLGAQDFYRAYARNARRGKPQHATLIDLAPSGSATRQRRVVLGPAPDQTYQIPYRYQTTLLAVSSTGTGQANLSAASDQPIVPLKYRLGIVYKAAARWARERQRNPDLALQFDEDYKAVMLRARQNMSPADDRPRLAPRILYQRRARHPYVSGRQGVSGTRWDTLAD